MRRTQAGERLFRVVGLAPLVAIALVSTAPAEELAAIDSRASQSADSASASLAEPAAAARQVDQLLVRDIPALAEPGTCAPLTDDATFLRRVSLDLLGVHPSPAEITAFAFDLSPDKRDRAVERMLADDRFGSNWGRYWRDVILYRRAEDRALLAAGSVEEYLTGALNRNDGWGAITHDILTATGNVVENGATALFFAQMGDAESVAAEASRIFLGVQVQCAQCHDHPTDRWRREQFHELAAFFPRAAVRPIQEDGMVRGYEVVSMDFSPRFSRPGQTGRGALEHRMSDLNDPGSEGELMTPVLFATGQSYSVETSDRERRETLATWLTSPENEWFAKAFVNRIWAELVGEGFYEPIDDLGPDRECSAPDTMDYLAREFAASDYDVKALYRTIMATAAYQRASRERHQPGETPFTANVAQPLRADQLLDSLAQSLNMDTRFLNPSSARGMYGARFGPRNQFGQVFGFDPSEPRGDITRSIPQALLLMNSQLSNGLISAGNPQGTLGRLLRSDANDEAIAVELYLHTLAREPKPEELAVCLEYVAEAGSRSVAFEDILWSLVNSTEFMHRY